MKSSCLIVVAVLADSAKSLLRSLKGAVGDQPSPGISACRSPLTTNLALHFYKFPSDYNLALYTNLVGVIASLASGMMSSENVFSLSKDYISAIDLSIQVCLIDMFFILIKACSLIGSGMKSSADIEIG